MLSLGGKPDPVPAKQEQPTPEQVRQRRRAAAEAVITELQVRFPTLFDLEIARPLALRLSGDLVRATSGS